MRNIIFTTVLFVVFFSKDSVAQSKRDYQWIISGDKAAVPTIIRFDFLGCSPAITQPITPHNFGMEGSNTSLSDEDGNLLLYSNGCSIVNKDGVIMENGADINPGFIGGLYCPGGSPLIQGVIALPAPGSDSLCYVFNIDFTMPFGTNDTFLDLAPEHLYYHVIDLSANGGLGKVTQKTQIAVMDTLARANIKAVRHANGEDWWVIVPKSHTNCYFLTLVNAQGVQPAVLKCSGVAWNDLDMSSQAVFSPDGSKFVRCDRGNGLNIFDFDAASGDLSNPILITFPNDTFTFGGVSVSSNSRFLYVSASKKLFQFDLWASDIEASKTTVAQWDGTQPMIPFYISALAPDNKIYISGISSHKFLHIIHSPDSLGLACNVQQRGLALPQYNYATIPNFPHYRVSGEQCSPTSSSNEAELNNRAVTLYPIPTQNELWIRFPEIGNQGANLNIFNVLGQLVLQKRITNPLSQLDLSEWNPGNYIYSIHQDGVINVGKLIIIE